MDTTCFNPYADIFFIALKLNLPQMTFNTGPPTLRNYWSNGRNKRLKDKQRNQNNEQWLNFIQNRSTSIRIGCGVRWGFWLKHQPLSEEKVIKMAYDTVPHKRVTNKALHQSLTYSWNLFHIPYNFRIIMSFSLHFRTFSLPSILFPNYFSTYRFNFWWVDLALYKWYNFSQ